MKIFTILLILSLSIVLFSGCVNLQAQSQNGESTIPEDIDPLLEDYLSDVKDLETPTQEYGESTSYILTQEDLVVRIVYPSISEIPALEKAIDQWILDTVAIFQEEALEKSDDEDPAELNIEYSSYLIDQHLVGVKMSGFFESAHMAHPIDIIVTFNADLETGNLLEIEDVLHQGGKEALNGILLEQFDIEQERIDENFLDNWLLTSDSLEVTLERGEYLAMSEGSKTMEFPYEEVSDIINLPQSLADADNNPDTSETPESQDPPPAPIAPIIPNVSLDELAKLDPNKPMIALTFDDGPSAHTTRLLDTFAAHGGKGTFFVVGNLIDREPATLQRIAAEGHEIGGHSWNHRKLTSVDRQELIDQIMTTRAKIYDVSGVDTTILRPPYGSYNDEVKAVSAELGIVLVNWSVDTLDWKTKDANAVYETVMAQAKDGAIILCHDLHGTTVDAMEKAIPDLLAQGYQLVTVSELLTYDGNSMVPGKVYNKR